MIEKEREGERARGQEREREGERERESAMGIIISIDRLPHPKSAICSQVNSSFVSLRVG
jgi:hypothetical protein